VDLLKEGGGAVKVVRVRFSLIPVFLFLCTFFLFGPRSEAAYISEIEANNSLSNAQDVDLFFTIGADPNILDSDAIPWVSISATGDGTFDYYAFTVSDAGARGIFDIDFGYGNGGSMDTEIFLFDAAGSLLAANDDAYPATVGGGGSTSLRDSYIDYVFGAAGSYVIAVGEYNSSASGGQLTGNAPDLGDTYSLQVSVEGHPTASHTPIPPTALLFGCGLIGLVALRRRFSS
jgi:hypothetical protein